jgi:hypothetical protein
MGQDKNDQSTMRTYLLLLSLILALFACQEEKTSGKSVSSESSPVVDTAALWLQRTVEAHGGARYDTAHYQFVFRDKVYTFHNSGKQYVYTRRFEEDGDRLVDSLWNTGFSRHRNGEAVVLDEEAISKYSNALNSVIYFATLPYKLLDPAVVVTYQGTETIKGQTYAVLEVRFREAGGGEDFEDEYRYWINTNTQRVDYLAYNYQVDGGGVRFRSAYNARVVEGILFQDYINWKAPVGTPLADLPPSFEAGELTELSRIETEQVVRL